MDITILLIFDAILIVVLLIKLIIARIAGEALIVYIEEKEYTPPSENETRECVKKAAKRMFKIRSDS